VLNAIINHLLVFSGWSALLLVFLLPALESSVFLGFVIPGETAVVVGGFLAYEHKVSLPGILAAGILGAIVGDSVGFAVGERWGERLLARLPKRLVKPEHVVQGKQMITRLGGRAVFASRWVSVLRALVPGLCGTSGMRYATFLLWNVIGGVTWATLYTMVGYLAGSAWQRVEHYTSIASYALLALIAVVIGVVMVLKHRRQRAQDAETRAEEGVALDAKPGRPAGALSADAAESLLAHSTSEQTSREPAQSSLTATPWHSATPASATSAPAIDPKGSELAGPYSPTAAEESFSES